MLVLNKLDILSDDQADAESVRGRLLGNVAHIDNAPGAIAISALTGAGIPDLLARIDAMLPVDPVTTATFRIPHADAGTMHVLHEYAKVLEKRFEGEYAEIVAEVPESVKYRLRRFLASLPAE